MPRGGRPRKRVSLLIRRGVLQLQHQLEHSSVGVMTKKRLNIAVKQRLLATVYNTTDVNKRSNNKKNVLKRKNVTTNLKELKPSRKRDSS